SCRAEPAESPALKPQAAAWRGSRARRPNFPTEPAHRHEAGCHSRSAASRLPSSLSGLRIDCGELALSRAKIVPVDVVGRRRLDAIGDRADQRADIDQRLHGGIARVPVAWKYPVFHVFVPGTLRIALGNPGFRDRNRRHAVAIGKEPLMRPDERAHEWPHDVGTGFGPAAVDVQRGELEIRYFPARLAQAWKALIDRDVVERRALQACVDLA